MTAARVRTSTSVIPSRAAADIVAALLCAPLAASASADDRAPRDPNKERGPVRTSIDALKRQLSDDTFSGGPRLEAALRSALPANGTLVSNDCGT
ncbi:MAG: hypothetical protein ACKOF7_13605, partial [Phycisphaerales bacterium]